MQCQALEEVGSAGLWVRLFVQGHPMRWSAHKPAGGNFSALLNSVLRRVLGSSLLFRVSLVDR